MLPSAPKQQTYSGARQDEQAVRPGSWWRLAAEDHPLHDYPAPDHGLILMVSEVRVIDGEMHTIVLHPHPLWGNRYANNHLKVLAADFLRDYAEAPDGEALREAEIASVMDRVQAITVEMQTPPDPMLLLERKKEEEAGEPADDTTKDDAEPQGEKSESPAGSTQVPAALLPSQDVVEAQKVIETRIAAFEAQKNWLTSKTEEISGNMKLISAYQMEKVNSTLASIHKEVTRAEGLLQNVQTMRLFLGEDMAITPLLDGKSADPSEPLTMMQRLLFLDEEIVINDLLEGFSDRNMDPKELSEIFSQDFSLVERMLPYPRCAAIVRVRRHTREFETSGMNMVELFGLLEELKADLRVHVLVRDGERLSMITADTVTSNAERFFPSNAEINALFQKRSYHDKEVKEILPDNVEYSDARAKHDQRALFYKRFLILMWGMHERTDVFGPFMPKGGNWLSQTTHSERFRFVHDEEDVLTDGRPSIDEYVDGLNAAMGAGSRVLAYWKKAVDGNNAPSLADSGEYSVSWKYNVELAEDMSQSLVTAEKGRLYAKCPAIRGMTYDGRGKPFDAKVRIAKPARLKAKHPDSVVEREISEGILCLDHATIEDIDYYANSRAARQQYLRFAHMLNKAHEILRSDQMHAEELAQKQGETNQDAYAKALRLWRSGNKWQWPSKDAHHKAIRKIMDHLANKDDLVGLFECQDSLVRGGIKANGEVFALCDSLKRTMPDGTPLPWLEEHTFGSVKTGKIKKTVIRHWEEHDRPGEMTIYNWKDMETRFLDRVAPSAEFNSEWLSGERTWKSRQWQIARGLFSADNAKKMAEISEDNLTPREVMELIDGRNPDALRQAVVSAYENYQSNNGKVRIPKLRASLGLAWATGDDAIPRAWVIDVIIDTPRLAYARGEHQLLMDCMDKIYAHPDKVFERIAGSKGKDALTLVAKSLKNGGSLDAAYTGHLFLSFDNTDPELFATHEMPKDDPRIGWKEILGSLLVEKDSSNDHGHFTARGWSADTLLKAAERINVMTGEGGEEVIQACFDERKSPAS